MSTSLDIDPVKLEEFQGRVIADLAAGYGGVMTSLGAKLGLYAALADAGPLTSADVAERAGCAERYVREWLNSQVAADYVDYDREHRTYELPAERAAVLADSNSPAHLTSAFEVVASMWLDEHLTMEAFRTGKGVPWGAHDERLSRGVAAFFRPGYQAMLVPEWLPAMDGVVARLQTGATVADIGCGHGHSTVLMAEAFPNSRFRGYDTHVGSILTGCRAERRALDELLGSVRDGHIWAPGSSNAELTDRVKGGRECRGGKLFLKVAVVELPVEVVNQGGRGRETSDCLGEWAWDTVGCTGLGASSKPVIARPSVGKMHDLVKYGVGQFGCTVGGVVMSVRCEKSPFSVVQLKVCGGGETKVGHDELMASR